MMKRSDCKGTRVLKLQGKQFLKKQWKIIDIGMRYQLTYPHHTLQCWRRRLITGIKNCLPNESTKVRCKYVDGTSLMRNEDEQYHKLKIWFKWGVILCFEHKQHLENIYAIFTYYEYLDWGRGTMLVEWLAVDGRPPAEMKKMFAIPETKSNRQHLLRQKSQIIHLSLSWLL